MEEALCPVCTKRHETGALLLETRVWQGKLRQSLDRKTLTGWGLCKECQKKKDEGYVALVVIDEKKSSGHELDSVWRTGEVAHLRAEMWDKVFVDAPLPPKGMCFIDEETLTKLKSLTATR